MCRSCLPCRFRAFTHIHKTAPFISVEHAINTMRKQTSIILMATVAALLVLDAIDDFLFSENR